MISIFFSFPKKILRNTDALVFFGFKNQTSLSEVERTIFQPSSVLLIQTLFRERKFHWVERTFFDWSLSKTNVFACGFGSEKKCSQEMIRRSVSMVYQKLKSSNVREAVLFFPSCHIGAEKIIQSAAESLWLSEYRFDQYKSKKEKPRLESVTLVASAGDEKNIQNILRKTKIICQSVWRTRDLANNPSDHITPEKMCEEVVSVAKRFGLKTTKLDERDLQRQGLGLLWNVGKGSDHPPRLMVCEYRGDPSRKDPICLVGKGITFDTGGVNLKTSDSAKIETMHLDMSGAAAVLGILEIAASLKLKVNVNGILALAENAISGNSLKPGSIIRAHDGTTVEVGNTDAEGRLIIGDAVSYAVKHYHPRAIIDIATLTGAVIVALGHHFAGLISNNDELANELIAAGESTGERLWRFPLTEDYSEELKSDVADLRNIGNGRAGGVICAGSFIEHFAKKIPWAHLDIAGAGMLPKARDYHPRGGNGFGVRVIVEYLTLREKHSSDKSFGS